jgi:dipeptidyl aminopeptidase/acylaminoacyl peptidase
MNDLATVLRDALDARVAHVAHDPVAYAEILRRRARRRLTRRARPIGVVAATAAVVGIVAVVVRPPDSDPVVPAGGAPSRVVTVRHVSADAFEVAVLGADDLAGRPVARMGAPANLGTLRAVAAVGDDRTFYAAWTSLDDCRGRLYRLVAPSGASPPVLDVAGDVTGLAVSPDGRRIAYAMWADGPGESICGGTHEIHVRDLASGQERVWATRSAGDLRIYSIVGLAWSPDGRYVAFGLGDQEVHRIDTTAAPVTIPSLPPDPFVTNVDESGLPPAGTTCYTATPAYLPTGELVAAYRCVDNRTLAAERARLVVLDPVTRRPGRTLLTYPAGTEPRWLALDPTGAHALLGVTADDDTYLVYRSDGGTEPRQVLDGDAARWPTDW